MKKILTLILFLGISFLVFQIILKGNPELNEQKNTNEVLSNFGNNQLEKAVTDYLLTQKHFSWKTKEGSLNSCEIENLSPENELFPLYVWANCKEYIIENGTEKILSGSLGPVKIIYPNELSFYDLTKFSYSAPRDGFLYSQDIKQIFPEKVQQKIFEKHN
ncbi:hypothetical protein M0P48_02535 [Candidatus Gracilibacteria bacterium]|jgi:hypothetical protein|nr:hypothetical protein [Candidatus Gracilibacteria bacterium]